VCAAAKEMLLLLVFRAAVGILSASGSSSWVFVLGSKGFRSLVDI
jgi:hypothetical protein